MSGIYNNPGAVVALQALQTANAALAKTTNELSTGKTVATVADDPAAYVIASGLRSDASALGAVSDCLCGAEVPTKVAGAAINSVSNILIDLKEAVINAQSGGGAATAEGVQIQSLLSQISSNVTDASVNGVNLISGALGGSVQATQIKVPADIYGQMMTIGDTSLSTRSAMNASVAGLGLNGAPSNLDGLNIQCPGLAAGNIATGAPATQLVLQTTNYGDPSSETSQFPGQSWTFQFTDAANPAPAAETPSSHDTYGNVLQQDNIIPVALKAGFTLTTQCMPCNRRSAGQVLN
jgi:flagellin